MQGGSGDNTLVTFTANNYDDGTGWHLSAWQNGELVSTCSLPDHGDGWLVLNIQSLNGSESIPLSLPAWT